MAAVYPWAAIRREYVEGTRTFAGGGVLYPTYEELARKYTCAFSTIAQRAAREGWPEQRRAFQEQFIEQASVAAAPALHDGLSFDEAAVAAAAQGIACIDALFRRFGAQLADKTLTQRELFDRFIDLEELGRALRLFQEVGKSGRENPL